jgi:ATP-dependent helicase/nuclease subunit B
MILSKENIAAVNLDELIRGKILTGRIDELLLIVPTNRKARNLKKEIISLMPGKSASGIKIETIGTISSKLLKESSAFLNLSEAASIVFIRQSAEEIKLNYFSIYKNDIPFGTLDRIKNVINEYKRHGINPGMIRNEADKLEKSERLKALDIAEIYENYLLKCQKLKAFDTGDILKYLIELADAEIKNNFEKLFGGVNLVIVEGFDEFAIPEIKILDRIADIKSHKFYLHFDYYSGNKLLFAHLDKIYDRFEELGFKKIKDESHAELNEFQKTIREKLFRYTRTPNKIDYKSSITKISAYDRDKEVELIAQEIKGLITKEKVEPHKIGVVFNLVQNYSSIVRDVFTKNGLPFNLTDRIPLDNSNPVTAVVNFLEIAENDFYFNNIFRALSSGFIDTSGIDFSNLLKVSSALKIVSGKENWVNTLQDEIANLSYKADYDDEEVGEKLKAYKKALNDIKTLADALKPFEGKLTFNEFRERLFNLVYNSKLPFKLLQINSTDNEAAEKNIRGFTEFIETITEIFQLLGVEYGEDKKFGLTFFMDQMRTACGWARFNVKEKSNYGVQVTAIEEIRGIQFDYLFIGGLCDGDFPTRYKPEIFFSGSFKKQAATHQNEERNLFYQALCCWDKKLFLSFSLTDGGKETVQSTFLSDFEDLFEISSGDDTGNSSIIYSLEAAQIFAGKKGIENLSKEVLDELKYDAIKNSIDIEKQREENRLEGSPFVGDLSGGGKIIIENLKSFSAKQYSISQLELYAKCPFKFFVERVLGVKKIEEPTEDIEAVEMGRILHSVLYKFYTAIRDKGIIASGCDEKTFEEMKKIIFEIADKELKKTAFKSPLTFYEKEKIFGIGGNSEESILNRFLENERGEESSFKPEYFEVSFGRLKDEDSDKILSSKDPVEIDGIKLRGKIDRVEISEKDTAFNIVDYKLSGSKPTMNDLKNGLSLQLPVYLYAAALLLKKKYNKNFSPNDMVIYSLKYSMEEFGRNVVSISRDKEIKSVTQLIDKAIEHVKNYIEQISKGKFGLSPHENREQIVCRYCQFKPVCRVQELAR